jgi:hypothetical protein
VPNCNNIAIVAIIAIILQWIAIIAIIYQWIATIAIIYQ